MSTDADRLAAEKDAADKRDADEAAAAAAASASADATANWPTGGYNSLIPLLLISVCAVLVICVDVSTICLVRNNMIKYQYVLSNVYVMLMIYSWINLIEKLLIVSTGVLLGDRKRMV